MRDVPLGLGLALVCVTALTLHAPAARADRSMVPIAGGCVFIGCQPGEICERRPRRKVCLSPFRIDRTEVTNKRYTACMHAGKCTAPEKPTARSNHPVAGVTWKQANAYCKWAEKRLPTEAEWERAARGTGNRIYPWGNRSPGERVAAIGDDTRPVCSRPDGNSPDGLCDMAGNVAEWVQDWYRRLPRKMRKRSVKDPRGPCNGRLRCRGHREHVFKGGSFGLIPPFHRISFRLAPKQPWITMGHTGLRCARSEGGDDARR